MTDALAQPYPERIAELEREVRHLVLGRSLAHERAESVVKQAKEIARLLDITRQQYMDADHGLRLRDTECRRLRSEASELMAEIAGLIQVNDQLKRDKADRCRAYEMCKASREQVLRENDDLRNTNAHLVKQIAWHVDNAKQQAERIRELEAEVGGQSAVMREKDVFIEHLAARELAAKMGLTDAHAHKWATDYRAEVERNTIQHTRGEERMVTRAEQTVARP